MALVTLPSATTTLAETGAYSAPLFQEFLSWQWIAIGILVGASLIYFLVDFITFSIKNLAAPTYGSGYHEGFVKSYLHYRKDRRNNWEM